MDLSLNDTQRTAAWKKVSVALSALAVVAAVIAVASVQSVNEQQRAVDQLTTELNALTGRRQLNLQGAAAVAADANTNAPAGSTTASSEIDIEGAKTRWNEGEVAMKMLKDFQNARDALVDREETVDARDMNHQQQFREQGKINEGFDEQLEYLEEQFDRVKSFRVSTHHLNMYEESTKDDLTFSVTIDKSPDTHEVDLELIVGADAPSIGISHHKAKWTKDTSAAHWVQHFHVVPKDFTGTNRVERFVGMFKSGNKRFNNKYFVIDVQIHPPCLQDNGGCAHSCHETKDGHKCSCHDGFHLGDDKSACYDTNECEKGTHDCDKHAECYNTIGNYECTCVHGYEGSGHVVDGKAGCEDVNECEVNPTACPAHADCVNTHGGHHCNCHSGFRKNEEDGLCHDINECDEGTHDCAKAGSVCHNTAGSFTCSCAPGWRGDGKKCTPFISVWAHGDGKTRGILLARTRNSYQCVHSSPVVTTRFGRDVTRQFCTEALRHHDTDLDHFIGRHMEVTYSKADGKIRQAENLEGAKLPLCLSRVRGSHDLHLVDCNLATAFYFHAGMLFHGSVQNGEIKPVSLGGRPWAIKNQDENDIKWASPTKDSTQLFQYWMMSKEEVQKIYGAHV